MTMNAPHSIPDEHGGQRATAVPESYDASYALLQPLVAAEAAAEVPPGSGIEAADVEQAVWLRLVESREPLAEAGSWVRRVVRAEVDIAVSRFAAERPYADPYAAGSAGCDTALVEDEVLAAEQHRSVRAAVRALPGRCPQVVAAMMSRSDPTYREISRELGISQGSLGPLRSRCLGCLRTILNSRVGSPVRRGNAR